MMKYCQFGMSPVNNSDSEVLRYLYTRPCTQRRGPPRVFFFFDSGRRAIYFQGFGEKGHYFQGFGEKA